MTLRPFLRHAPTDAALPLVLDSPHSGEHYPDDFDHARPRALVRQAEDTHVARLYRGAPGFGATLIEATFPRAYIDANRSLADIDLALLADPWPAPVTPSRKTEQGIGLVWRIARGGSPMYDRKLTADEVQRRIDRWYVPYHAAVTAEIDALHGTFGAVWHVNCHSMPAVSSQVSEEGPGKPRADFVLGDRDGTTCSPEFTQFVRDTLASKGYDVKVNDPYKGVELVRAFSDPASGRHSLQVEVNRRLYMDESTREKNAGFAALKRDIDSLVQGICSFAADRGSHACAHEHHHDHHHDHEHGPAQSHGSPGHKHES